jgi:DNA-directed RNA polymerase subunit RPC12/RpoP
MEWRCEWCGKPHEENDPPCDNCGHGSFEKAVVQRTDLSEGSGPESTTVWVCTECGRTHTKHSPPCSRCGNHKLVREQQYVDDAELSAPGYLDLVTPRYLAGVVAVLVLAGVFVLGVTGVVHVPGLSPGLPPVSDVPGDAETAGDRSLSAVEAAYLEELNDRRREAGLSTLDRNEEVDEVAEFANQRVVKARYGDGDLPDRGQINDALSDTCTSGRVTPVFVTLDRGEGFDAAGSDAALGEALVDRRVAEGNLAEAERSLTGLDVHVAPDGTTHLAQFTC